MHVHSYPKIWNLGHPAVASLFIGDVIVEEKVDGSQFSFGVFDGKLACRSKCKDLVLDAPEKMFLKAVETCCDIAGKLREGWTYRGEYLMSPKHNVLSYDRIPERHIAIFDIQPAKDNWLSRDEKVAEAERIGLEHVPVFYRGKVEAIGELDELMKSTSCLGGPQIEGVVIKNYGRFGQDGKPLFGKQVRADFKEQMDKSWKERHPPMSDIRDELGKRYQAPARWQKAVQRLRESGELTMSPKDIGALLRTVQADLEAEIRDEVARDLMAWAMPQVKRIAIRGLPEWWKQKLLEQQFAKDDEAAQ